MEHFGNRDNVPQLSLDLDMPEDAEVRKDIPERNKEKSEEASSLDVLIEEYVREGDIVNRMFRASAYIDLIKRVEGTFSPKEINRYLKNKGITTTTNPEAAASKVLRNHEAACRNVTIASSVPKSPPIVSQKDLAANDKREE